MHVHLTLIVSASIGALTNASAGTTELELVGDAQRVGNVVRLVPAGRSRVGAAWLNTKQFIARGFAMTFQFQITASGGKGRGADGLAFVLHGGTSKSIGANGGAGGFAFGGTPGIPRNIAVFFDTFKNETDPSGNFISITTGGKPGESSWPPSRLALVRSLPVNLKDGKPHTAKITYHPPVMTIGLDSHENILATPVDLRTILDDSGRGYVGFTSSTGNGWGNHDILNWTFERLDTSSEVFVITSDVTFAMSDCLPDKNLCTPSYAQIEETRPGQFRIVLPAHLEWGASLSNPTGAEVAILKLRGYVCWDPKATGGKGCGTASLADTLATRLRNGRTEFSVHEPPGGLFHDNEGYLEFDVIVKK